MLLCGCLVGVCRAYKQQGKDARCENVWRQLSQWNAILVTNKQTVLPLRSKYYVIEKKNHHEEHFQNPKYIRTNLKNRKIWDWKKIPNLHYIKL